MARILSMLFVVGCSKDVEVIQSIDPSFQSIIVVIDSVEPRAEAHDQASLLRGLPLLVHDGNLRLFLYMDPLPLLQVPLGRLTISPTGRTLKMADLALELEEGATELDAIRPTISPPPFDLPPFDPEVCVVAGGCTRRGPSCDVPCSLTSTPAAARPPKPPLEPEPPSVLPCPIGWIEVASGSIATCRPPPLPPSLPCLAGEMQSATSSSCARIGRPCSLGPPPADVFIQPGDGTIAAAIAANPGAETFALDGGEYRELGVNLGDPTRTAAIALLGTCVELSVIVGDVFARSPRVTIRDLTIRDGGISQDVPGATEISSVVVERAPIYGIVVTMGSASLSQILVRGSGGAGLLGTASVAFDLDDVVVERATGAGIVTALGSTVTGSRIAVRQTLTDANGESSALDMSGLSDLSGVELRDFAKRGLVTAGGTVAIQRLIAATSTAINGIEGRASKMTITESFIEGPDAAIRVTSGSRVALTGSRLASPSGILAELSSVTIDRTAIDHTRIGARFTGGTAHLFDVVVDGMGQNGIAAPNVESIVLRRVRVTGTHAGFALTSGFASEAILMDVSLTGSGGGLMLIATRGMLERVSSMNLAGERVHFAGASVVSDLEIASTQPASLVFRAGDSVLTRARLDEVIIRADGETLQLESEDVDARASSPLAVMQVTNGASLTAKRLRVRGSNGMDLHGGGTISLSDGIVSGTDVGVVVRDAAIDLERITMDEAGLQVLGGLDFLGRKITVRHLSIVSDHAEPAVRVERQVVIDAFTVEVPGVAFEIASLPKGSSVGNGTIRNATCGLRILETAGEVSEIADSLLFIALEDVPDPYCR